jgi:hypothetical protein
VRLPRRSIRQRGPLVVSAIMALSARALDLRLFTLPVAAK